MNFMTLLEELLRSTKMFWININPNKFAFLIKPEHGEQRCHKVVPVISTEFDLLLLASLQSPPFKVEITTDFIKNQFLVRSLYYSYFVENVSKSNCIRFEICQIIIKNYLPPSLWKICCLCVYVFLLRECKNMWHCTAYAISILC